MKLAIEHLQILSQTEVPTWNDIEMLLVQLDDDALRALNEVVTRIQSACSCEDEARVEGSSKREDR